MLNNWHRTGSFAPLVPTGDNYLEAITEQGHLGGFNFLLGRLSHKIVTIQETYFRTLPSNKWDGDSWASALILQLIDIPFHMWLHRNTQRHDPDGLLEHERKEELLTEVTEQIDIGEETLMPQDQYYLLSIPLARIESWEPHRIGIWLKSVLSARAAHERRVYYEQQEDLPAQNIMQQWLSEETNEATNTNLDHLDFLFEEELETPEDNNPIPIISPASNTTSQRNRPTGLQQQRKTMTEWLNTIKD